MKKMLKIFGVASLTLLASASYARADVSIICGDERNQGVHKADVGYLQNDETGETKLYVSGKQIPADGWGPASEPNGDMSFYVIEGDTNRKFVFREKSKTVQEYFIDAKDVEKKVGGPHKCNWTDTDPS